MIAMALDGQEGYDELIYVWESAQCWAAAVPKIIHSLPSFWTSNLCLRWRGKQETKKPTAGGPEFQSQLRHFLAVRL